MVRIAIIAVCAFLSVSVRAQSRTLTVEEAIVRARERAPERLRVEALERQAEGLRQNASTFFAERPELEVEYMTEKPFGERDYELSLGILQEIPIWSTRARRVALADAVEQAGGMSRDLLERQIALRTRLLFNRAWALSEQVALGNRLIVSSNRLVEASNKRLAVGDISTLERNTIVLETNRQRIEHESVHSSYDQAIGELEALTGLELNGVSLTRDTSTLGTFGVDSVALYRLAPDYTRLESEIRIAQAQLDLARSELLENPTVGLHYAQDLLTIDEEEFEYRAGASKTIQGITAPGREVGVSLSLQIPITLPGLWGPDNLEVIEREAELRMLEGERTSLQIELSGRLAQLRPQVSRIERALRIYQESVDLILQNHELLDRGYEGGELSVTDLLVGRRQLIELQTQQLELIQEMREAEIELQSILGR